MKIRESFVGDSNVMAEQLKRSHGCLMFDVEVTELNPSLSFTILLYDEYIYIGINNHNFDKLQAAVTIRLTDSFTVQGHTHCPQAVGAPARWAGVDFPRVSKPTPPRIRLIL